MWNTRRHLGLLMSSIFYNPLHAVSSLVNATLLHCGEEAIKNWMKVRFENLISAVHYGYKIGMTLSAKESKRFMALSLWNELVKLFEQVDASC